MSYQLKMNHFQIESLELKADSYDKSLTNEELQTTFSYGSAVSIDNQKSFAIVFNIILENIEMGFKLSISSVAHFETDNEIDDEFMQSSFVKINAPAIAFPYLRTFISNLTLNSGYNTIILPSFNFVKMASEKNLDKE